MNLDLDCYNSINFYALRDRLNQLHDCMLEEQNLHEFGSPLAMEMKRERAEAMTVLSMIVIALHDLGEAAKRRES